MLQFGYIHIPKYAIISLILIIGIVLPLAIIDADRQKDEIKNMDCYELRDYIIDKADGVDGFTNLAETLFDYQCGVNSID